MTKRTRSFRASTVRHGQILPLSILLAMSLALGGCAAARSASLDDSKRPISPQAQDAQLIQQSKTAMAACDNEFPAGNPKTAVARRQCINDGFSIRLPTFGPDQDLVRGVLADSMVIAGKVEAGTMTIAEGNAAIATKWSEAIAASQKRSNSKNSVLAQQSAAAAQQQQRVVAPADGVPLTPVELPTFKCTQAGTTAICN